MNKLLICLCAGTLVLGLTACTIGKEEGTTESTPSEGILQETPKPTGIPETESFPQQSENTEIKDEFDMIRQAVVEVLGENYWPNTQMPATFLEEYGLTEEMYEGFLGEMPMISTNVDTLIVVKAKEGKVEAVEEVINKYRENLVNDTMQYPMNVGKIQASRIETFGNYVCFVQLGADTMDIYGEESNEEAVIKHCQEQNELAIEAIGKVIGQ